MRQSIVKNRILGSLMEVEMSQISVPDITERKSGESIFQDQGRRQNSVTRMQG
jgi:hypothetical protein